MDVINHQSKPEKQKLKVTKEKAETKKNNDETNQFSIDEQIDQLAEIIIDILLKEHNEIR